MRIIIGLMAAILIASSGGASAKSPQSLKELDTLLGAMIQQRHIPGASVAIVENGQVVLAKGYGYADVAAKVAATADTPFRAGSISKSFTSIAVMQLVEQHELDLEDRVASLLPQVRFTNPWERTDPVRLVNLLEHTTGWPDISTRVLAQDGPGWSTLKGVQFTMREFVSRWKPGYFTVYNNAGPAVAGLAIEKASGKSYDQYMRDAVLRPMGMARADFDLTPDLRTRIAKSYTTDGTVTPYQYIVLKPAGSLNVSARELAQLVRLYLGNGTVDGHRILTPESVARIERSEADLGAKVGFHNAYALGNAIFPDAGMTFRGHNGSIDSFTSVLGYNRATNSGYVLMANGGEGVDFATPISALVQGYLTRHARMVPPPTVQLPQADLEKYAGFYRIITPPNDLLRPYGELLNLTYIQGGDGQLTIRGLGGAGVWVATAEHSFRRTDREAASLAFVEDGGRVYKIGPFNAAAKEPLWLAVVILLTVALTLIAGLVGIVMLIPWLIGAMRGRLSTRGGLAMRLMPLASFATMAAMAIMPLLAFTGGTSAVHQLADIGPYSLTILGCSILFPLFALAGVVLGVRGGKAPHFIQAYVTITSFALLVAAGYFAAIGWFAMRTWQM
jgi:CubicO group peptidase (beta-lactamase class C family)